MSTTLDEAVYEPDRIRELLSQYQEYLDLPDEAVQLAEELFVETVDNAEALRGFEYTVGGAVAAATSLLDIPCTLDEIALALPAANVDKIAQSEGLDVDVNHVRDLRALLERDDVNHVRDLRALSELDDDQLDDDEQLEPLDTSQLRRSKQHVMRTTGKSALPASPEAFLERYLREFDIDDEDFVATAHDAVETIQSKSSRSPAAIAGAAVLVATSISEPDTRIHITQRELTEHTGVSGLTLRQIRNDYLEYIGEVDDE